MSFYETSVHVDLGDRSYPIYIGANAEEGVLSTARELVSKKRKCGFLVDGGFAAAQTAFVESIQEIGSVLVLPSGEQTKCMKHLADVYDFLAENRFDRSSCLFAVGGGVVGDLTGYAAASYLRGIDFYQVPTTLLSMVDSSVGGKTGINIPSGKNLVGAFWQPQAVFSSTCFLETLTERDFNSGMAEVIKHGMLYDLELFERLEALDTLHATHPDLPSVIKRNCEIKSAVVNLDEKEVAASGGRALLNLGHTYGHAIENAAGYGDYMHGEAIGLGLVMATDMSVQLGNVDESVLERVKTLVARYGLPVELTSPLAVRDLTNAMLKDKKVKLGKLHFVALGELGRAITLDDVEMSLAESVLRKYGAE